MERIKITKNTTNSKKNPLEITSNIIIFFAALETMSRIPKITHWETA